jgi:hypothetical protein
MAQESILEIPEETRKRDFLFLSQLLSVVNMPMTYDDLVKKTGYSIRDLRRAMSKLIKQRKIMKFKPSVRKVRGRRMIYTSHDLFGDLANEIYFYKPGQEEDVIKLIIQKVPPKEEMNKDMKHALTYHLKRVFSFPESKLILAKLHGYYAESLRRILVGELRIIPDEISIKGYILRKVNRRVKEWGLEVKTIEDLKRLTKVLSEYGLLKSNAIETGSTTYVDPNTRDELDALYIRFNSPKLKIEGDSNMRIFPIAHKSVKRGDVQKAVVELVEEEYNPMAWSEIIKALERDGFNPRSVDTAIKMLYKKGSLSRKSGKYSISRKS